MTKKSPFLLIVQVETFSWNIYATALQNKFQQALHRVTLKVETCSAMLKLVSKFVYSYFTGAMRFPYYISISLEHLLRFTT